MRKTIVTVLLTSLFLSSITTSQASYDGVWLGNYSTNTVLYQSLKVDQSLSLLDQIIVLPKNNFDQKEAAEMINRISLIPDSILEKIKNNGITLNLFTGKLTDNPTASHLKGKIPRGYANNVTWDDVPGIGGSKVVLVKIGASEKGQGHGSINLELHELAHSIDYYVFNEISGSKEFLNMWETEHEQLFPGNSYFQYPEEYFAETFAMYYLNTDSKELLRTKAPKTFEFMKQLSLP
ncbi:anthrax toxin lethal factor-related metalloendopeptidase [Bacillus sp. UNC41MFS5]|uniref:anthrax toxin lethal factor-related metalloendopeptidase n=1 Tax=Bacillus sp. UNC41MFS5 TaxID=1449046 RepID=UPI000479F0EB|nr:toxin [Bacillus sp. UNC41MFS5]